MPPVSLELATRRSPLTLHQLDKRLHSSILQGDVHGAFRASSHCEKRNRLVGAIWVDEFVELMPYVPANNFSVKSDCNSTKQCLAHVGAQHLAAERIRGRVR